MGLDLIKEFVFKYAGRPLFYIWITHASYVTIKITYLSLRASFSGIFGRKERQQQRGHQSTVLFFPDKTQLCPSLVHESKKCPGIETCLYGHKETSI